MKSSYINLTTYIIVFLGIITTVAISKQNGKPKTTTDSPRRGSQEKEEITSEEKDLDKEIFEEHTQTCVELLVDCWLFYNKTKPYLKEYRRERICYKRVHGFPVCAALDQEDIKNAKKLADAHLQEELDKKLAYYDRRRRLQELREEWEDIRDSVVAYENATQSDFEDTTGFVGDPEEKDQ